MTGDERRAVATLRDHIPTMASTGVIAKWLGAAGDAEGKVIVTSREHAASLALSMPGDPVVIEVVDTGEGNAAAIPWASVVSVTFSSLKTAREFGARQFYNFNPSQLNILADKQLFDVESEQALPDSEVPGDHRLMNRICGAIGPGLSLPLRSAQAKKRDDVLTELLKGLIDPGTGQISEALEPILVQNASLNYDDKVLLEAIVQNLLGVQEESVIGGRKFLAQVKKSVVAPSENIVSNLEYAEKVVESKIGLPEFIGAKGLRSGKALLLFVLQPNARDTLAFASKQPNDQLTVFLASVFAGLFSGWTRLPSDLRGDADSKAVIERHLAKALEKDELGEWSRISRSLVGVRIPEPEISSKTENPNEPGVSDSQAEGEVPYATSEGQLNLGVESGVALDIASSSALQLASLLEVTDFNDASISGKLARGCKSLGWNDLVVTQILLKDFEFRLTSKDIKVDGFVPVTWVIDRAVIAKLKEHVGKIPSELEELLVQLGGTKPKRTRKPSKKVAKPEALV